MSLIQDALKKAQKERLENDDSPDLPGIQYEQEEADPFFTKKRIITYSAIVLVLVVAVIIVIMVFKPKEMPSMAIPGKEKPVMSLADINILKKEVAQKKATVNPGVTNPVKPGVAGPVKPGVAGPLKPGVAGPVKPGMTTTDNTAETVPVKPGVAGPPKPGVAGPVKPGVAGPPKPTANPDTGTTKRAKTAVPPPLVSPAKKPVKIQRPSSKPNSFQRKPVEKPFAPPIGKPAPHRSKSTTPAPVKSPPRKAKSTPHLSPQKSKPAVKKVSVERAGTSGSKTSPFDKLLQEGNGFNHDQNFVLAVDRYKKALKLKKTPALYFKLYSSFRAMKNPVLARAYIDDGIRFFPENFLLNKISAILYIRAKDYSKALANIEVALGKDNKDYALLTYKGLCYFHKKNYEEALISFRDSLRLSADAVENYYYIGLIYDNTKYYKKALEFYHVFLKLSPESKNFRHRNWVISRIKALEQHLGK
ncbi:MAG: hypothetical protein GY757_09305 [bacterium]|nr:hypothetical protein [bacterium]